VATEVLLEVYEMIPELSEVGAVVVNGAVP
jgi:hypothetical protein